MDFVIVLLPVEAETIHARTGLLAYLERKLDNALVGLGDRTTHGQVALTEALLQGMHLGRCLIMTVQVHAQSRPQGHLRQTLRERRQWHSAQPSAGFKV